MRQLLSVDLRAHLPLSDIQTLWQEFEALYQEAPDEQVFRLTDCEIPQGNARHGRRIGPAPVRTIFVSVERHRDATIATMQFGEEIHS